MIPKIKRIEFRNVHIDENVYTDNDLFLSTHGLETSDATHKLTMQDLEKMLLHEPEIAIFGVGFKSKVNVSQAIINAAKKQNVETLVLSTPDAVKKFQELIRKGKKVVAKLHITC